MSDFDINGYLDRKLPTPPERKINAIMAASEAKRADLRKAHANMLLNHAAAVAQDEAQKASFVGRNNIDPESALGSIMNLGASAYAGVSRGIGDVVSLVPATMAAADESNISQPEFDAYNRFKTGKATPEDVALLNTKKAMVSANDTPEAKARAQAEADANPNMLTALQLIERAQASRETARNITQSFDRQDQVHQGSRDQLRNDLGKDFQSAWDQTGLSNLFEKDKSIGGALDIATGLGKLVYNAGEAAVTNPQAAAEYMAENVPQLLVGGVAKWGKYGLAAMNAGYAVDNYSQGIENFKAANNGQLPDEATRQRMAMHAAGAFLAEHLGELGQLGAIGKISKVADPAKGVVQATKNVVKAGALGGAEEAATEGFQTYAEGEAQLKPASAKDIYEGASIGGMSGAGLSSGGRTVAEVASTTPEDVAAKERKTADFKTAAQTGDVSVYTDPKSRTYDPTRAVAALYENSKQDGATQDTKEANLEKANEVVTQLQERQTALQEKAAAFAPEALAKEKERLVSLQDALAKVDPTDTAEVTKLTEAIASTQTIIDESADDAKVYKRTQDELSDLNRHLEGATGHRAQLERLVNGTEDTDLNAVIDAADTKVDAADVTTSSTATKGIDQVINLSMASPEKFTTEMIDRLVNNKENSLTPEQRTYLRTFSEAKAAENELKDMGKVTSEVIYGTPDGKNIGLSQYRERIATAMKQGNVATASKMLDLLGSFADSHKAKAAAVAQATNAYAKDQTYRRVERNADGSWSVQTGFFANDKARAKNGGLNIGNGGAKLLERITKEANTITKLEAAMSQAVGLKSSGPVQKTNVAPSTTPAAPATASPTQAAPVVSEATEDQQTEAQLDAEVANNEVTEEDLKNELAIAEAEQATEDNQGSSDVASVETKTEDGTSEANAEEDASQSSVGLDVLSDKTIDKPYQEKNLIADFFTQAKEAKRPLAVVKDFLTQVQGGLVGLMDYLNVDQLTDVQQAVLDKFQLKARVWQKNITENLGKNKPGKDDALYRYKDLMQYFIVDGNIEENVKTAIAYAAFNYINEKGGQVFNSPEEINMILGRPEDTEVTREEYQAFAKVGVRQNVLTNSMGQRIVEALGLKPKADAPVNLIAQLQSVLGTHAMKLMMDRGILQRTTISGEDMKYFTTNVGTDEGASFQFVRLARNKELQLHPEAQEIFDASKGSQQVLDKLFKVESEAKEPSLTPVPFKQKSAKNSTQEVPKKLRDIIAKKNAEANYLRQDMWHALSQLSEKVVLGIAGVKPVEGVHAGRMVSVEAKNAGLQREYTSFKDWIENVLSASKEALDSPMYFEHTVWNQQRVGINSTVINPQSSKIHRHLLYRQSWTTKIDMTNQKQMDNFRLRVLEGFGVKTDKKSNESNLLSYEAKTGTPAVVAAVSALRKTLEGSSITEAEQQVILTGVQEAGENFHSFDVLMALAHEAKAKAAKQTTFEFQGMTEVDGVTNGPMLSHLLLGAATSVSQLFGLLNRGGFYEVGNKDSQYNIWRGQPGRQDLYETTTGHVVQQLQDFIKFGVRTGSGKQIMPAQKASQILSAIYTFTGALTDTAGSINKDGRNIIKTPLTAMVFGSSVSKAVDSMADNFIEKIYDKFEDVANGKADLATVVAQMRVLGVNIDPKTAPAEFLTMEFSKQHMATLKENFGKTMGMAVRATMNDDFGTFMERRTAINQAAKVGFEVYNAVYQPMRAALIKHLIKDGEIAVNGAGKPIHDLTKAQEVKLLEQVDALFPTMQTLMSKESNQPKAGLFAPKRERQLSQDDIYKSEVHFKKSFGDTNSMSAVSRGMTIGQTGPGARMAVMSVHSTDSAISHYAAEKSEVLNVHDAHGAGWDMLDQTARNLNQATWYAMLHYSPAHEAREMLSQVITGTAELLTNKDVSEDVRTSLKAALEKLGAEKEIPAPEVLMNALNDIANVEFMADKTKFEALSKLASIDQYALEGGNYVVTDADRAEATEKAAQLSFRLREAEVKSVNTISQELFEKTAEPKTSPFGTLGKPKFESDPELVALFEDKGTVSAREVINILYQKLSATNQSGLNGFNLTLLKAINKVIPKDLKIQLITADTTAADVIGSEGDPFGWYSLAGNNEAIYIKGRDFEQSKITPELLMHEMLHAALGYNIENALKGGQTAATELVAELSNLLALAQAYAGEKKLAGKYQAALKDVHELVSWGMTNKEFQTEILSKIQMQSKTTGNKLVDGMKAFIGTLSKFLFKNPDNQQLNGLSVLIQNTSGLLKQASESRTPMDLNLSMDGVASMTTLDIHEALGDGTINPAFDKHLKSLLQGIVETIHGPFGTLKTLVEQTKAKTPLEAFHEAQATGVVPFASDAVKGGFRINAQESFAIDQVEATVRAALKGNEGDLSAAYAELYRLYSEARTQFKSQDFSKDPQKQALVDFVFKIDSKADGRSDYLSRFAALGLAHEEFRSMLDFATDRDTRTVEDIKGIPAKLVFLFNKFLNFFNSRVTHTYSGQSADAKLQTLVEQLVSIETRRKQTIEKFNTAVVGDFIEESVRKATDAMRKKVGDIGESDFFQKSSNEFVKLTGNVMSIVGYDRANAVIDTLAKYRDYLVRDKQGMVAGMLTEVRGLPDMFQRMLRGTKLNEKARKNVISWTAKTVMESFVNQEMDEDTKAAVTNVFLRTDMAALLDSMTMEDLMASMTNTSKMEANIKDLEQQLATQFPDYVNYFKQASRDLAYHMVTGKAVSEHLMLNAKNIASMFGTSHAEKLTTAQTEAATKIIDQLVSLRAIQYTDGVEKTKAMKVFKEEMARTDGGNGIAMLLNTHLKLQKESRERLFVTSEALMIKGYLPEITDPNVGVRIAQQSEAQDLLDQGYKQVGEAMVDPKDYNQEERFLFVLEDGGLNPHTTGIFSLSSLQSRGTEVFMASHTHQQKVLGRVKVVTDRMFTNTTGTDPRSMKKTYAVPILNPLGKTTEYRYMMQAQTRDAVLRRDNRFDKLLGTMAGQTLDKVVSAEQNANAVKALKDFYEADLNEHPDSYLRVGPTSTDPELREIWNMLPLATRAEAIKVWGNDGMMVRNDMMDINFGYRKLSIADLFEKETPNAIEHQFIKLTEMALYMYARHMENMSMVDSERYKKRAAKVIRRIERIWQEVVHEMKDIIVMKTGTVMIGNILSNVSLLMMNGVPFIDIVKTHRIAMTGALEFQRDQQELFGLKQQLATGQTRGKDSEIKDTIKRLEDRMARNPVRELMEAGLMPSIVEDVAAEEDIYSYKTELVRKAEQYASKLNPKVVDIGRTLYMAHDTDMYKWLNHVTQLSDFVARYTLYQYQTTKKNPMSKAEAIQNASDSFINYDIPSHRKLQYLDDMGIFMFTKYFLRIQKVLLKLTREHPTRVLGMIAFDHFINLGPLVTDSSFISHFGNNPFRYGAIQFPTVLDDIATVHAGLQIFK